MNSNTELYRLALGKLILPLVPARLRRRIALSIYDHTSANVKGVDIVVKQPGYKLMVNTKDLIGWNIFFFSEYEKGTNNILSRYVKPGDTVIEAGANIGSETILLANLVGDSGKVYAFEPNKDVFNRLSYNARILNKKQNITCMEAALGEKDGIIQFNVYPDDFFNSGMSSKYHTATDVIDVKQLTLDSLVKNGEIAKVDFIKMDVQGAELDVLLGATETLSKLRPHIFLEAHENQDRLFELLTAAGYNINIIHEKGLTPISKASGDTVDWLAVHRDKAQATQH
jgi:FkbM family methyltransferase